MKIINALNNIAHTGTKSVIIRHAERYPITNMETVFDVLLTDKGKEDSFNFGKNINDRNKIRLYHSPIKRCAETAYYISKGLSENNIENEISGELPELGGPYVLGDWNELAALLQKYDIDEFVRMWFNGNIPENLLMPLDKAAYVTLNILSDQLLKGDATYINVSHDWNIMILREFFFALKHEDIGLPDYLDGFIAYIENYELYLNHQNEIKKLNLGRN